MRAEFYFTLPRPHPWRGDRTEGQPERQQHRCSAHHSAPPPRANTEHIAINHHHHWGWTRVHAPPPQLTKDAQK